MLQELSSNMAIRFNAPVFLVGSFIDKGLDGMDIDLVMPLSEKSFKRMFGAVGFCDKQLIWRLKQKEYYEKYLPDIDIDFKPQTINEFNMHKENRIRLDEYSHIIKFEEIKS